MVVEQKNYTKTNTNTNVWPGCRGELGWSGEAGYRTDPSSDCLIVLFPLTTCSWNKSKCSVNLCSNLLLFLFSLKRGGWGKAWWVKSVSIIIPYPDNFVHHGICTGKFAHIINCFQFCAGSWLCIVQVPYPYIPAVHIRAKKLLVTNASPRTVKNWGLIPPNVKTREGTECSPISSCWAEI